MTLSRKTRMKRGTKRMKRTRMVFATPDPQMREWARGVIERAGGRCQWPEGCRTYDKRIDPHHIAERSLRPDRKYDPTNGIALCRTHHEWLPLHRAEAIAMGLLSDETYEKSKKD